MNIVTKTGLGSIDGVICGRVNWLAWIDGWGACLGRNEMRLDKGKTLALDLTLALLDD